MRHGFTSMPWNIVWQQERVTNTGIMFHVGSGGCDQDCGDDSGSGDSSCGSSLVRTGGDGGGGEC